MINATEPAWKDLEEKLFHIVIEDVYYLRRGTIQVEATILELDQHIEWEIEVKD